MSAPDQPPPDASPPAVPWDLVFQGVGIGAAVAGWIAVVGGGRVWARLESAHIPATQTLSGLPKDLYVVEGLQTLLVPLLLGVAAAILAYFMVRSVVSEDVGQLADEVQLRRTELADAHARDASPEELDWRHRQTLDAEQQLSEALKRSEAPTPRREDPRVIVPLVTVAGLMVIVCVVLSEVSLATLGWAVLAAVVVSGLVAAAVALFADSEAAPVVLLVALGALLPVAVLFAVGRAMELWPQFLLMVLTTGAAITAVVLALLHRTPRGAAVILFGTFVAWSGALAYLQEWGDKSPKLEQVRVDMNAGEPVRGYLVGRSKDHLYVAQDPLNTKVKDWQRHVTVLNGDDIERVVFGRELPLPENTTVEAAKDKAKAAGGDGDAVDRAADAAEDQVLETPQQDLGPAETPGASDPDPASGTAHKPLPPVPIVARKDLEVNGVPGQFQVLKLVRREGMVELDAQLANLSERKPMRIGDAFDDGDRDADGATDTVDGLRLLDPHGRKVHLVDRDDAGECPCATALDAKPLEPGGERALWASFAAPPADVRELDLIVPGAGYIRGVKIDSR